MKIVHHDSGELKALRNIYHVMSCGTWLTDMESDRFTTDQDKVTCKNCRKKLWLSTITDTDRLNFLAERVYLPRDIPTKGVFAVVSEDIAALGSFSCNRGNDRSALRAAIDKMMVEK